jgi:hypothetical protein
MTSPDIIGSADNPEHHHLGYDYSVRFPDQHVVRTLEGGTVYSASGPEGFAVITNESTLVDMLGVEDMNAISIRIFSTPTARDSYLRERGWT